jgi:hypothetical protein
MKSSWIKSFILLGALTLPSHAILGVGVHLAPAFGPEVKASSGNIMPDNPNAVGSLVLSTGSVSGLTGIGTKFWIDFLPFIDVEATTNIQVGYYDMAFILNGDTTEVEPEFDIPLAKSKPFYGRLSGDVAVLYPFFKIPLLKLYAGGGLSYIAATPVLNNSFAKEALTEAEARGEFDSQNPNEDDIRDALVGALEDEGLQMGLGFFAQAGAKVKPPIIPIALYANAKYGFGGPDIKGVTGVPGLTAELGAAFAF